jgi:hypothetical protein
MLSRSFYVRSHHSAPSLAGHSGNGDLARAAWKPSTERVVTARPAQVRAEHEERQRSAHTCALKAQRAQLALSQSCPGTVPMYDH